MSDTIFDVTNDLLLCEVWDESKTYPNLSDFVTPYEEMSEDVPFYKAEDLVVPVPDKDQGSFDAFIGDFIGITVEIGSNKERLKLASGMVVYAVENVTDDEMDVKRDNLIARDKCEAEGAISNENICLGWNLKTRSLLVELPIHKHIAWSGHVKNLIHRNAMSHADLLSLIRKLENVITIVKMMGHFMKNLPSLEEKALESIPHSVRITATAKADAKLHLKFLEKDRNGISMNLLTFRRPNYLIVGDACEYGLGDFNVESRIGCRHIIPPELRGHAHINLLEFPTQLVQIWLDSL